MKSKKLNYRTARRRGFTLTELLVVIAIIGLLSGIATIGYRAYMTSSAVKIARVEVAKIVEALDHYHSLKSRYPTVDEGIEILGESTSEFPGGLLKGNLNDPWNQPYEYILPGSGDEPFDVISAGPDLRFGTQDDIASYDLANE